MTVKVFNASSPLTAPISGPRPATARAFASTTTRPLGELHRLPVHPATGEIKITVRQGATVLADITVNDSTYTNGLFGFYNYSQEQVKYSGFRRLSLAQGNYVYDVEAFDPDGDAITYSLDHGLLHRPSA